MAGSKASAANHRRGDSSGGQTRCEPGPNSQTTSAPDVFQKSWKVEALVKLKANG